MVNTVHFTVDINNNISILQKSYIYVGRFCNIFPFFKCKQHRVSALPWSIHCSEHYQERGAEVPVGGLVSELAVRWGLELVV